MHIHIRCDLHGSKSQPISPSSYERPLHRSTSIELSPIPSPPALVEPMQFASTQVQVDDSTTILRDTCRKEKLTLMQEEVKSTRPFQIPDANIRSQSNRVVQHDDHVNHSTNYASTPKNREFHDEYHPDSYPEGCIGLSTHLDMISGASSKSVLPNTANPYQTNSGMKTINNLCTPSFSSKVLLLRQKIQKHFSIPSKKIVDRSLYLIDEFKSDNVKNGENFHKKKNSAFSYDRYRSKNVGRKAPRQTQAISEHNMCKMLFCGYVMSRTQLVFYAISFGIVLNVAIIQTYFSVHQIPILDISKTTKLTRLAHQHGAGRVQRADYHRKIFVRVTWPNQSATVVMKRTENFKSVDGVRKITLPQNHVKYDIDHTKKIIDNRKKERRRRTSKSLVQDNLLTNDFKINKYEMMSNQWVKKDIKPEDLESTIESLPDRREVACLGAGLTTSSRVVITGILTIPAASAFALFISKHCNVELIQGVDKMIPNTQKDRINAMTVYQNLLYRIPSIKLVIPNDSAGFDVDTSNNMKDSNSFFPSFLKESENWMQDFKPTHIIHFESMLKPTFEIHNVKHSAEDDDPLPRSIDRLFLMKNSILSTEQLLRYVLNIADGCQKASCEKQIQHSTRFLYINSGQQLSANHNEQLLWNGIFRANYLLFQSYFAMSTAAISHKFENTTLHHLRFPNQEQIPANEETESMHQNSKSLSVKEAVMSILRSLNKESTKLVDFLVPGNADHSSSVNVVADGVLLNDFHRHLTSPYGLPQGTMNEYGKNELRALLGLRDEVLPCASSCTRGGEQSATYSQQCTSSPFDDIIPISVEATKGCGYVVFVVEISQALNEIIQPLQSTTSEALPLCRIAFISEQSSLVQRLMESNQTSKREDERQLLRTRNGKLKHDSWTLIWLPFQEESMMSDADFSLLIIDPSKLFAPTVSKSMYTSVLEFAEPSDESLLRIMGGINRPKIPKHMEKEYRSGHKIFRFVEKEAENARSAILFGMEPSIKLETLTDYQMLLNASDSSTAYSSKQMQFYEESSHIIESDRFRLETEIQRDNYFDKFPFQWISMGAIIHDLRLDESLSLRCSWYKEHLFWGTNGEIGRRKGTEPLSLAYLLGKMKLEGTVGPPIDLQQNWYPLLDANTKSMVKNERGAGIFLRIMKRAAT